MLSKSSYVQKILYPYYYKDIVENYAIVNQIDPLLVISVIREESHFRPESSSHKGAVGLMQLMPNTAREIAVWLGETETYSVDILRNPDVNIRYGTWYLTSLKKEYSDNLILALAAYNAGTGRVKEWLVNEDCENFNSFVIADIPYKETRDYVEKVLNGYRKYSELYGE